MIFKLLNKPQQNKERIQLLKDIDKTKFALETAYSNFDNVTEPDLIDCYIYEVNSSLKRYKYLLEQAAKLDSPPGIVNETSKKSPVRTSVPMQGSLDLNFEIPYSLLTGPSNK